MPKPVPGVITVKHLPLMCDHGATPENCPQCCHFDRYPHDKCARRPDLERNDMIAADGKIRREALIEMAGLAAIDVQPSFRIFAARERGEVWAQHVTKITVSKLPDRQRRAFYMFYWGQLECSEIAQVMGGKTNAIKNLLVEARKNILKMSA